MKNYVQRIVDVRPNLVLVEKTVSRIAQDLLLEHGITLVINVKPVCGIVSGTLTEDETVKSFFLLLFFIFLCFINVICQISATTNSLCSVGVC